MYFLGKNLIWFLHLRPFESESFVGFTQNISFHFLNCFHVVFIAEFSLQSLESDFLSNYIFPYIDDVEKRDYLRNLFHDQKAKGNLEKVGIYHLHLHLHLLCFLLFLIGFTYLIKLVGLHFDLHLTLVRIGVENCCHFY